MPMPRPACQAFAGSQRADGGATVPLGAFPATSRATLCTPKRLHKHSAIRVSHIARGGTWMPRSHDCALRGPAAVAYMQVPAGDASGGVESIANGICKAWTVEGDLFARPQVRADHGSCEYPVRVPLGRFRAVSTKKQDRGDSTNFGETSE